MREREERAKQESEKLEEEEWIKYEEEPRRKQIGGGSVQKKGGWMDRGESMVGQPLQATAMPRKESVKVPTGQPLHLRSRQICRACRHTPCAPCAEDLPSTSPPILSISQSPFQTSTGSPPSQTTASWLGGGECMCVHR